MIPTPVPRHLPSRHVITPTPTRPPLHFRNNIERTWTPPYDYLWLSLYAAHESTSFFHGNIYWLYKGDTLLQGLIELEDKKYSFNAPIIISAAAMVVAIVRRNLSAKYRSGPNSFSLLSPSLGSVGVRVDSPRFECEWHRDYRQRGCCFSQRQRRRQQPGMRWRGDEGPGAINSIKRKLPSNSTLINLNLPLSKLSFQWTSIIGRPKSYDPNTRKVTEAHCNQYKIV